MLAKASTIKSGRACLLSAILRANESICCEREKGIKEKFRKVAGRECWAQVRLSKHINRTVNCVLLCTVAGNVVLTEKSENCFDSISSKEQLGFGDIVQIIS